MKIKNNLINIIVLLTVFLIFAIDTIHVVFKTEFLGRFGVFLWSFSYLFFIIYSIYSFANIIKISVKVKSVATLLSLLFIIFIVLGNSVNPKNISSETTQETACAIDHILTSPDGGFWKTCLFGYPTRQYFLTASPTFLLGRNLFSLNFGGSLYLFIGLPIFAYGLWLLSPHEIIFDYLIGAVLISFFHIYSFNFLVFQYEQSIFPFSLTLIASGLVMAYSKTKKVTILLLIFLVMEYLIYSYTTSLFVFVLLFIFVILFFLHGKSKLLKLFILILSLSSLLFSFKFRQDVNIFDTSVRSFETIYKDLIDSVYHLFFQNKGVPLVSPVFNFIFLFFLFGSIFFIFGAKYGFIGIWMLAVIVFSLISKGYAYYGLDFRLNRILVIFPILFMIILNIIKDSVVLISNKEKKILPAVIFIFLFLFGSGYFFHNSYIQSKSVSKHYLFIDWFKKQPVKIDNTLLLFDDSLEVDYGSLKESLKYFLPNINVYIAKNNCDADVKRIKNIYLLTENINNNKCIQIYKNYVFISTFQIEDKRIGLYKIIL